MSNIQNNQEPKTTIPRVFVSYSHDSQEHKKWVLDLAVRLRNTGIDAILDQWELTAGADIPNFMETELAKADYILMICTDNYVKKANAGTGGVGYEKMMITAEVMKSIESTKVIPIIKQNGTREVPIFLKSKYSINLSNKDSFEFNYDELIRKFHNAPLYEKPEIGNNPFTPIEDLIVDKTNDEIKIVMKAIVDLFEEDLSKDSISKSNIIKKSNISRILVEIILQNLIDENLIKRNRHHSDYLEITMDGRKYAVKHKLV